MKNLTNIQCDIMLDNLIKRTSGWFTLQQTERSDLLLLEFLGTDRQCGACNRLIRALKDEIEVRTRHEIRNRYM